VKVSRVRNRAGTLGAVSREEDRTWPRRVGGDGASSNSKLQARNSFLDPTSIYENTEYSPLFPTLLFYRVNIMPA